MTSFTQIIHKLPHQFTALKHRTDHAKTHPTKKKRKRSKILKMERAFLPKKQTKKNSRNIRDRICASSKHSADEKLFNIFF